MSQEQTLEYRIGWSLGSIAVARGHSEWESANPGESVEEIENGLERGNGVICDGLEIAIDACGFEWWVETREQS